MESSHQERPDDPGDGKSEHYRQRFAEMLGLSPDTLKEPVGGHWSHYRNLAKTEEGHLVYIDPEDFLNNVQELYKAMKPHLEAHLREGLAAIGLDADELGEDYGALFAEGGLTIISPTEEPITEVPADSPDLPEVFRPAVEAFAARVGRPVSDYSVCYWPSDMDKGSAEFLIIPKWMSDENGNGGVVDLGGEP